MKTIGLFPPWPPLPVAMLEPGIVILISYLLDICLGDPRYTYHPARIMGWIIVRTETWIRRWVGTGQWGGTLLVLVTAGGVLLGYLGVARLLAWFAPPVQALFWLYMTYSSLALGDLLRHVRPVAEALEQEDVDRAREALAMTVGRDVQALDRAGIARAAVETLGENFVDGFLSPLFWYFSGWGVSGFLNADRMTWAVGLMLLFKVASTLDSMVGYKNERYLKFGRSGARLDDMMNFLPARLSIPFLFLGASLLRLKSLEGIRTALRDRLKHDSPNSAHPESFLAGALGIRLGGPTQYVGGTKEKPWLGDGLKEAGSMDIRLSMSLLRVTGLISVLVFLAPAFLLWLVQGVF